MRCPACSYLYFKKLDACPKCGGALGAAAPSAQITIDEKINSGPETVAPAPAPAAAETAPVPEAAAAPETSASSAAPEAPVAEAAPPTPAEAVASAESLSEAAAAEPVQPAVEAALEPAAPEAAAPESVQAEPVSAEPPAAPAAEPAEVKAPRRKRKAREAKAQPAIVETASVPEVPVDIPPEAPVAEAAAPAEPPSPVQEAASEVPAPEPEQPMARLAAPGEVLIPDAPAAEIQQAAREEIRREETALSEMAAQPVAAPEPAPVQTESSVPFDEQSFSRIERPEPAMPGIELKAPAPLPEEVSSGRRNVEILASGVRESAPPAAKPRVRVKAGTLETASSAAAPAGEAPIVTEPLPSAEQIAEVTFHPAAAPEAPKPLEAPRPVSLSMPEPPRPDIRVRLEPPKVELPKPRPMGGEPIAPKFQKPAVEAGNAPAEMVPESAYEYEFEASSPDLNKVLLDTRGAGRVTDPHARPMQPPVETASGADDTFTRLVESAPAPAAEAVPLPDETSSPMSAEAVFNPVAAEDGSDSDESIEFPADIPGDLDEISDNLAQRVAGEPVGDSLMPAPAGQPVRTLFPEILSLEGEEGQEDEDGEDSRNDGDDDGRPGTGTGFGGLPPPSFTGGEASLGMQMAAGAEAAAAVAAAPALLETESSGPQALLYEQTGGTQISVTGNVSVPSLTPPGKRIEQIFDEITDMSQRLEGPVVPSPDPIVPFNDGRFPGAEELDPAVGFDGLTRVSDRAADDLAPDQISFRLGSGELTPESQLQSADVLGSATGVGIRLDTPPGIGLTGKLDNWPAPGMARKRLSERIPKPSKEWLEKLRPRISLPRQLLMKRTFSYLIDTGLTVVALVMFVAVADKLTGAEFSLFHDPLAWLGRTWWVLLILKTLIEGIFYVGLVSLVGQTPGDMMMRLKIVSRDGADATPAHIVRRYFWLWPFNLVLPFGALTFLAGATETAYDRRAGTRVVETV